MRTLKTLIVNKLLFFVLLTILFYSCGTSQEIQGNWEWSYQEDKHETEITLTKKDATSYWLSYCSVFNYGNKMDCDDEGNNTILITKLSNTVYQGIFKSNFSGTTGKIKITVINENGIKIELIEEPKGEYYFPKTVNFKRT